MSQPQLRLAPDPPDPPPRVPPNPRIPPLIAAARRRLRAAPEWRPPGREPEP